MKKFMAFTMSAVMLMSLAACAKTNTEETDAAETTVAETVAETTAEETVAETTVEETEAVETEETEVVDETDDVMSYADYVAADMDAEVVVTGYVQATQSWWDDQITVYLQDEDGAYFLYNMTCSEADAELLVPGTEIKVTGYKSEWSGEVEIVDATFEILDGNWIAEAKDVTDLLGTDELIDSQNQFVSFTDMTVVSVAYKNEEPGDDIYVTLSKDDAEYEFCLEYYLNGSDEEFYELVGGLEEGQTVDVEGFLYWYEGANTHLTSVTVK
ncbi:MAG: hypothetical protein MJ093_04530 [Saccharofermentans sp.]|nr:hypothetical protein [Saccharofermentans sp.]